MQSSSLLMSVVKAGRLERPVVSFGRVPVSEDSAGEREEAGPGNMGSCWTGGEEWELEYRPHQTLSPSHTENSQTTFSSSSRWATHNGEKYKLLDIFHGKWNHGIGISLRVKSRYLGQESSFSAIGGGISHYWVVRRTEYQKIDVKSLILIWCKIWYVFTNWNS